MSPENNNLSRRSVLSGIGATGVAAAVGGLGMFASTQGAVASAGGSIDDPATAVSDDGRIKWVATQTTGRMTWDGFDEPVQYFKIINHVELKRNGSTLWQGQINDTGKIDAVDAADNGWGKTGEEVSLGGEYGDGRAGYIASDADWGIIQRNRDNVYNNGYGLPSNPAPASYLYSETDGEIVETKVILKAEYVLYRADGSELTGGSEYPDRPEFSASFVVSVENEAATTGSGGEDADGDTEDSATVGV